MAFIVDPTPAMRAEFEAAHQLDPDLYWSQDHLAYRNMNLATSDVAYDATIMFQGFVLGRQRLAIENSETSDNLLSIAAAAQAARIMRPGQWYAEKGNDWFLPLPVMRYLWTFTPELVMALVRAVGLKDLLFTRSRDGSITTMEAVGLTLRQFPDVPREALELLGGMMSRPAPYHPDVTVQQIIDHGWGSGFRPEQTHRECREMGHHHVSLEFIQAAWAKKDEEFRLERLKLSIQNGHEQTFTPPQGSLN